MVNVAGAHAFAAFTAGWCVGKPINLAKLCFAHRAEDPRAREKRHSALCTVGNTYQPARLGSSQEALLLENCFLMRQSVQNVAVPSTEKYECL